MGIRDLGRYEIPFYFNGNSFILKVTKFSTCDDVIHKVLHKLGLPVTKVALYAMFERTSSLERLLSGKSLVYKVWRSWGCERKHFEFHIKCKESKLGLKRNFTTKSSESVIDDLFLDHYNEKAKSLKDQSRSSVEKNVSFNLEHNNSGEFTKPRRKQSASSGKQIVLARYLYDLFKQSSSKKKKNQTRLPGRERGDGTENENFRCTDDTDYNNKVTDRSQREKCRYFWDKYYASDSESESDDSFTDESSEDSFSISNSENFTLDTAFVKSSRDSDSDEGIDVRSVESVDLDTAYIGDLDAVRNVTFQVNRFHNNLREDTMYTESYAIKNQNNPDEFEMNVSEDEFLKELFGKAGIEALRSEDDEMDSFMRSRLDSF